MANASFVVSWDDVLAYVQECRERAIVELAASENDRQTGKAQGKLDLCNELLNLKAVFQTIQEAGVNVQPHQPTLRDLAREAYRAQLQGGKGASHPPAT